MSPTPLISLQGVTKGFSERPLFKDLSIVIAEDELVALLGNNGSGKSTLLKILAGLEEPDSGNVSSRKGLRCAYVAQQEIFDNTLTVSAVIEQHILANGIDPDDLARRSSVALGTAGFHDGEAQVSSLSGGWRKRLAIASAMALEPELLLLDEPTNHLDIDSIAWLEEYLASAPCSVVFVSHDRYFIERIASRVIEISQRYPNDYISSDGGYADFLDYRESLLEQLEQQRASLANKVRREVDWLRQGVKARTTKSRSRINEAHRLIDKLRSSPGAVRRAQLDFSATQRKTKELLKAEHISQGFNGTPLFSDISLLLSPGSRLAIVGPNGSGKTTLIRTLLGDLAPTAGRVVRAPNLRVAFLDQARKQLTPEVTLKRFLCPDGDSVYFQGESIHVAAWAMRFLFTHHQLSLKVSSLSGGEQARALLARIMTQDVDILLFDEPTNDLDITTLEVLEESLDSFAGALVLVTHDRYLLERTGSSVLGIRPGGSSMYASYDQWEQDRAEKPRANVPHRDDQNVAQRPPAEKIKTRLSYNDERELKGIERALAKAEELLEKTQGRIDSGEFSTNSHKLTELCSLLTEQQAEVTRLYARWQELETLKQSFGRVPTS